MFKSFFDPRSVAFLGIDVFGGIAIWYAQLKAPAPHCKICTSKWRLWCLCHIYVYNVYAMLMSCLCIYAMFLMFVAFQGAGSIPVVSLLALAPAPGLQRSCRDPAIRRGVASPRECCCCPASWPLRVFTLGSLAPEGGLLLSSSCHLPVMSVMSQTLPNCTILQEWYRYWSIIEMHARYGDMPSQSVDNSLRGAHAHWIAQYVIER